MACGPKKKKNKKTWKSWLISPHSRPWFVLAKLPNDFERHLGIFMFLDLPKHLSTYPTTLALFLQLLTIGSKWTIVREHLHPHSPVLGFQKIKLYIYRVLSIWNYVSRIVWQIITPDPGQGFFFVFGFLGM